MTTKLKISPTLSLPTDAVTSTLVVYGGKGMGKTNLASVLVEEFSAAGLRFAVIDPMGVWWGLRHGADGKSPGIKVLILGGIHGDLPITPESGALVADLVVDEDASVIIDISRRADGSMWAIAERIRFVRDYAKRIYQRQGESRRPINQVIDEAARFAPQIVRQGESDVAACMGAIAVLVEEGRNVGIGVTLVTQRSARLNKDVAELADCMIAFRIVGPNSMRAVLDWLGEHVEKARLKELGEQLRSLPRGSALVISPGWLEVEDIVAMRKRETFDSSATPKAGEKVRTSGAGAKVDLAKYRERLATLIDEQKANDPKALKARVAELERQVAAEAPRSVTKTIEIEKLVIKDAQLTRIEKLIARFDAANARVEKASAALSDLRTEFGHDLDQLRAVAAIAKASRSPAPAVVTSTVMRSVYPSKHAARVPVTRAAASFAAPTDGSVSPAESRILQACAWMESIGQPTADVTAVAFLAGYTVNGHFTNMRGKLRSAGLIEYPSGGTIALTATGRAAAPAVEVPRTLAALHDAVRARLDGSMRKLLDPLIAAYPNALTTEDLAAQGGYTVNGHFTNMRGRLRSLGLAEYPRQNYVRAADLLFPEGLA